MQAYMFLSVGSTPVWSDFNFFIGKRVKSCFFIGFDPNQWRPLLVCCRVC